MATRMIVLRRLLSTSTTAPKQKFFVVPMFPYPSGTLHMGHVRVYTISDVIARVQRMRGFKVVHPIGWDAFGLPAENAAIDRGIQPAVWTMDNISQMKRQLNALAVSFDWDREVTTCSPDYYKWTQWLFLRLHRAGLAYQREAVVNWDPVDQTVLANEQVDSQGRSWRSGAVVVPKKLKQWFFKITEFAEPLLQTLPQLNWPENVKQMQHNWIGKSSGVILSFKLDGKPLVIDLFTTRVETIFGATFVAVAADHPILHQNLIDEKYKPDVELFMKQCEQQKLNNKQQEDTTTGVFTGLFVTHPLTHERLPVFSAAYVLGDVGVGAVMGVPAHDSRDASFASRHNIPIKPVIVKDSKGVEILSDSGDWSGETIEEGRTKITAYLQEHGLGKQHDTYRLRDWLVSRQRFWGAPIPIVHCQATCATAVPVPEEQLPVELPAHIHLSGRGASPLTSAHDWIHTTCPQCGGAALRDTDTMDTFVDSSWYFLRYLDAHNQTKIFDTSKVNEFMPLDVYVGGIEHAILHLLYARFLTRFLHHEGFVNTPEPFKLLLTQGMVHGRTLRSSVSGKYLTKSDVLPSQANPQVLLEALNGAPVTISYEKMSKSKYNGVDPQSIVDEYGVDTTRLFVLFKAPVESVLDWDESAIQGPARWLRRLRALVHEFVSARDLASPIVNASTEQYQTVLNQQINQTILKVTHDLTESFSFNTAVAELMILSNALSSQEAKEIITTDVFKKGIKTLILLLAPMAPATTTELWTKLSPDSGSVHEQLWPSPEQLTQVEADRTVVIQVNGKKRAVIQVPAARCTDHTELAMFVQSSPVGEKSLRGHKIDRFIVANRNIINFIVKTNV